MSSFRVLQIIPDLGQGGAEHLVLDICRGLRDFPGIDLRLITLRDTNHYPALTTDLPWRTVPARFTFREFSGSGPRTSPLLRALEEFRPDIIHSHLFEAEIVSRCVGYRACRYFTHVHGPMRTLERTRSWPLSKRVLTDTAERLLLLRAYRRLGNHFITVSVFMEEYVRGLVGSSWPVTLLPNAIDLTRFPARPQHAAPSHRIQLITVGRLARAKNQSFLIDVMRHLIDSGHDASLTVLGEGEERQALSHRVSEMGLSDRVSFLGRIDDVSARLATAHVYVHSASLEPFGLALVEAMATGLPIVALDGRGNRGIVRDGRDGFIVTTASPTVFAERIREITSTPGTYARFCREAAASAQRFAIGPYLEALVELYRTTLRERVRAEPS